MRSVGGWLVRWVKDALRVGTFVPRVAAVTYGRLGFACFVTVADGLHYATQYSARRCVRRGVRLLDEKRPQWVQEVKRDILDISKGSVCILGQAFGDYLLGKIHLELGEWGARRYGFQQSNLASYTALQEEWEAVLLERGRTLAVADKRSETMPTQFGEMREEIANPIFDEPEITPFFDTAFGGTDEDDEDDDDLDEDLDDEEGDFEDLDDDGDLDDEEYNDEDDLDDDDDFEDEDDEPDEP